VSELSEDKSLYTEENP